MNIQWFLYSPSFICSFSHSLSRLLVGTELLSHISLIRFCVHFSFCCIIKQLVDCLEQNICYNKTSFHPTNSWDFIRSEGELKFRTIEESIYIRVNIPPLNRNIGKFNLQHIWDGILINTPGLKIKRYAQDIGHAQSTQTNTPMHFFTGSMEHAQRTPLSEHAYITP